MNIKNINPLMTVLIKTEENDLKFALYDYENKKIYIINNVEEYKGNYNFFKRDDIDFMSFNVNEVINKYNV